MKHENRIIWVFREPRSGSTWYTTKLCKELNRQFYFFDANFNIDYLERESYFLNRKQDKEDIKKILNTHHFFGLKALKNYRDPIIIRVTRKNKTEQFLSEYLASYSATRFLNITDVKDMEKLPKIKNVVVPYSNVDKFIEMSSRNEELWKKYATEYEHETMYYEELLEGTNSNIFSLQFDMKDNEEGLTLKLPYKKEEIFLNYDKINNRIKDMLNNHVR